MVIGSSALRVWTYNTHTHTHRCLLVFPAGCCRKGEPHLVVRAVLLLALAALQQVGGGAAGFGHLVFPDGRLGEIVPQLL